MKQIGGLSGASRERLAKVLRQIKGVISANDAAKARGDSHREARRLLAG